MAAIAATTLSVALAGTSLVQSASGAPRAAHKAGFTPQPINWGTCSRFHAGALQRAVRLLTVPMDYAHPHGKKIKLAVSRRAAHHAPTKYQGVMLVNPGGPGGSAWSTRCCQTFVPNNAGDGYDWIGFDPRGVGSSMPSLSCDSNYIHGDRAAVPADHPQDHEPVGQPVEGVRQGLHQRQRRRAVPPRQDHRQRRDMESLRKALGQTEDQLLRLLLRHVPRLGLHDAAPGPGPPLRPRQHGRPARTSSTRATWTRTSRSRRPSTSTSAGSRSTTASTTSGNTHAGGAQAVPGDESHAEQARRPRASSAGTSCSTCSPPPATTSTAGRTSRRRTRSSSTTGNAEPLIDEYKGSQPDDEGR